MFRLCLNRGDKENIPHWLAVKKPRVLAIEPMPLSGSINRLFWGDVMQAVKEFSKGGAILGIGKPSVLATQLLSIGRFVSSFYDVMDDFPAFYRGLSNISMSIRERAIVAHVTKVIASSTSLCDRLTRAGRQVKLVSNACASTRLPAPVRSLDCKQHKIPILGYVGTIGQWFDWRLVKLLAKTRPDLRVTLIGPVYSPSPESLPDNVEILPPCPHDQAMAAMKEFDVGLIPFKKTKLTASVDPIKFYEYRALGLPVISSAFGEMVLRDDRQGVFLVEDTSDLAVVINRALGYCPSADEVERFRNENSWESRFQSADLFSSV